MKTITCEHCGAEVKIKEGDIHVTCEYCGSQIILDQSVIDTMAHVHEIRQQKADFEKEKYKRQDERAQYHKNRVLWRNTFIGLFGLIVLGFVLAELTGDEIFDSMAFSIIIFAILPYGIAGRPKSENYLDLGETYLMKTFSKYDNRWRISLLVFLLFLSFCWGLPEGMTITDRLENASIPVMIFGPVLFAIFRPSKYNRKLRSKI